MAKKKISTVEVVKPISDAFDLEPIFMGYDEELMGCLKNFSEEKRVLGIIAEANTNALEVRAKQIAVQELKFWELVKEKYNLSHSDAWGIHTAPDGDKFIVGKYNTHKVKDI